jgi:hypothetical protein
MNSINNIEKEKNEENDKVIMTPVFATEEQEESFFQASRRHLTDGKKLEWDEEKNNEIGKKKLSIIKKLKKSLHR